MIAKKALGVHPADVGESGRDADDVEKHNPGKAELDKVYGKVTRNLLPIFYLMITLSYIDRTNLAFASIQLNQDLGFSPEVYGLGSGLFFLGYAAFQVPSNLILMRIGAPLWLSIIIFAWGLCATAFCMIKSVTGFYVLRFLLGATESGAFPGMWYYLSQFYPDDRITTPYAVTEAAIALSHTIAAPTAAVILSFNGLGGLRGWQWLFLLEGLPSVALGLAIGFILPSGPSTSHFLSSEERDIIQSQVANKPNRNRASPSATKLIGEVVTNWQVWYLSVVKIFKDVAIFGTIFWTPKLINDILTGMNSEAAAGPGHGHGPMADAGINAVLLTSIPFTLAAVSALWSGHHSQATGERHLHVAVPYMVGGAVLSLFPLFHDHHQVYAFLCLVVAIVGAYCGGAPSLALVTATVSGPAVAIALPFYNSVGNLGGFVGPYMVGFIKQRTGSYGWATFILGWMLFLSGIMMVVLKYLSHRWRKESGDSADKLLRTHGDRD